MTAIQFYNGMDALKCIEETELDLAIIDVMLPDIDGFRICQKIREKFYWRCPCRRSWQLRKRR